MTDAMTIKLKPDCELAKAIDQLENHASRYEFSTAGARAHLLEVIHGQILTGIRSQPVEGLRRANEIMGVVSDD